ncbi:MAG: preprotein translocase subunit SecY [Patescibacteria group bacterium]|nr:MAG: preprotein translocase subunit SecY [Patescibacteria group bacterium]
MEKLLKIWRIEEIRNSVLFVLAMLVIFRIAAHIPVPGANPEALKTFFAGNDILGLLNIFSGGGMENFSIVMMGVGPYITASIIFQLLTMLIPKLEEMNKEEAGKRKITMWTRWATVPFAMIQSYSMIILLRNTGAGVIQDLSPFDYFTIMATVTAGTIFLMWLGELISEKKVGNGISLMIFAGIIAGLPSAVQELSLNYTPDMLTTIIGLLVIGLITVVGVVVINEGQRNIPVQYARQMRGGHSFGGNSTHLPLRVNMAGVIPIIFAISVVLFPPMVAQFFVGAASPTLASAAQWVINFFNDQLAYGIMYFLLVFGFTYFYTEIVFHPSKIAENLQKQGGFIPGIRPGRHTTEYLGNTTHKIILVGALFLSTIAVLPLILQAFSGLPSLAIGGTSLLIVVSVVIDAVKQIQSQVTMREYSMD